MVLLNNFHLNFCGFNEEECLIYFVVLDIAMIFFFLKCDMLLKYLRDLISQGRKGLRIVCWNLLHARSQEVPLSFCHLLVCPYCVCKSDIVSKNILLPFSCIQFT